MKEAEGFNGSFEQINLKTLHTKIEFDPIGPHNPIICVTGVSAVGKDYLLNSATKNFNIPSISVGSVLSELTGIDRDKIREMEYVEYFEEKRKTAEFLVSRGKCFINSHLVTKHRDSLVIDGVFERIINPMYFVAIIGDPKEIIERRRERNEKGRKSDVEDEETITYHQRLTLRATHDLAQVLKSGFAVVFNNIDDSKKNIAFLRGFAKLLS